MIQPKALGLLFACLLGMGCAVAEEKHVDNGTDPTKQSRKFTVTFEHTELNGGLGNDLLKLNYQQTLPGNYTLGLKLPVTRLTGLSGEARYEVGDVSVSLNHVFGLSKTGGYVLIGELVANTAARTELGTGKNVFKGTFIAASFLEGGHIFAPAIVQTNSIGGDSPRADVNNTTIDFYFVPKLADPRNLITYDPSLVFDWEAKKQYGALAITFGRVLGKAFGGNAIVTIKPTGFFGGEAPGKWGLEVGYKVVGF